MICAFIVRFRAYHNGEIPEGYEIHHVDEKPANNAIYNLQCLTKSKHQKLHNQIAREQKMQICPVCGEKFLYKHGYTSQIYCAINFRQSTGKTP